MREPDLEDLLGDLLDGGRRAGALEDLLHWLKAAPPEAGEGESPRTLRLRALAEAIAGRPDGELIRAKLAAAWRHASAVRLLAETGLPDRSTFFGEALRKLVDSFVPKGEGAE